MISSSYSVIKTRKVNSTAEFYEKYFGFQRAFNADWYVSLKLGNMELAILDLDHISIPEKFRGHISNQSVLLNFETDHVDEIYRNFRKDNLPIHLELRDEPWGQRHFISEDPNGIPLDIIKVIPPSEEFLKQYQQ